MRIRQSVCIPKLKPAEMSMNDFCGIVADIGYDAVEIWMRDDSFDEVVEAARKYNLAICSMIGHASLEKGLNDRFNHDRIESELKASIDIAVENGVLGLICFSGNVEAGRTEKETLGACADGLRRIAPYAEEKEVNLNLELLNSKVDHKGYQCDHTSWGRAVIERVGSTRVKMLYDIYHMQIMEGDVIRTIRENIHWIGHFHTAGNPGRNELDDTQELNYAGICKAIAETDYSGFVGHEFKPKGNLIHALKQAFRFCDQD